MGHAAEIILYSVFGFFMLRLVFTEESNPIMSEPKSRRIPKPIWFGVVAVLMVVLSVFLSVWLPYHREQVAIREIERLGGRVFTEWDWDDPEWIEDGPEWLRKIFNDGWLSWFDRVRNVWLNETQVSDEGLKHLSGLTSLQKLWLQNTQISDEGLKHLNSMSNLIWLYLDNTQVSDEGLKSLTSLANLSWLALNDTQISNEGLKHLSDLTNLEILELQNTQVTDEGVKELQKALPGCRIAY
jgi:Leucine-rich repeat (LRR) protein